MFRKADRDTLQDVHVDTFEIRRCLREHDAWAKSTHTKANIDFAESKAAHEKRQKEWHDAASTLAELLVGMGQRMERIEASLMVLLHRRKRGKK